MYLYLKIFKRNIIFIMKSTYESGIVCGKDTKLILNKFALVIHQKDESLF